MTPIIKYFLITCLFFISMVANALQVHECENEEGNRGFYKYCPPGMILIGEKSFKEDKKAKLDVTHYSSNNCDGCDLVRDFFKLRKIEILEKNVDDNVELQGELRLLAGELRVPTVVIGEEVIVGFNRNKLLEMLAKAGWKDEDS